MVWGGSSCCEVPNHLRNVQTVCTNSGAIAAITEGKVVTWGDPEVGGDSSAVEHLLVDVRCVCPSSYAFAALKNDGSVVCWGCASAGGDCFAVQDQLHDVCQLSGATWAFTAVKNDGSAVTWGDE